MNFKKLFVACYETFLHLTRNYGIQTFFFLLISSSVDQFVSPQSFLLSDESVLEESQSLVSPEPHQLVCIDAFQGGDCFRDAAHPASQFSRGVDVVRLVVLREMLLKFTNRICALRDFLVLFSPV